MSLRDYGGISRETIAKEQDRIEQDRAPSVFLGLDDGEAAIFRILPGRPGEPSPFHGFWKHTYTDPISQQFVAFACPKRNAPGSDCEVCNRAAVLMARGRSSKVDSDLGYSMSAKKRVLVGVYLRLVEKDGRETVRDEVLVWEFGSGNKGKSMHEELLAIAGNARAGGDFVNPMSGFDFMLKRTGKLKQDTTYKLTPLYGDKGPLIPGGTEEEILAVLERMHDLGGVAVPPSAEELRQITGGGQPQQRPIAVQQRPLPPAQPVARRTAASYMEGAQRVQAEVLPKGYDYGQGSRPAAENPDDGIPGDDDIPF